jgi:DNA-binding transcriptional ArsR family regulator
LWASRPTPPGAQVELLGRSRATILAELDQPATTTSLAQRLALSPATVSGHLKVMQRAGLLTSHRVGHHVRYKRTGLGDDTVAGLDAPQRT